MTQHYLDNSATTEVLESAAKIAFEVMIESYGNPSSLHGIGTGAKFMMDDARNIISESLSALPAEIYFTSGGTEGNNIAIFGAVNAKKRFGNKIVTTEIEHPSVLNTMKSLEKDYEVVYISPEQDGSISEEKLQKEIDGRTILVSIMHVNNETGAVLPVTAAADTIKKKDSPALLHCDMVQSYRKLEASPKKMGVDIATVSGHKVHGPKGIGALYVSKGKRIVPHTFGGSQEKGIRPGTESTPLIAAFADAVKNGGTVAENFRHVEGLYIYLKERLCEIPEVTLTLSQNHLPYILNFSAGRVKAQTMLNFLSGRGVYVSSGSACDLGKPSHVLSSMGLEKTKLDSSLRVSLSHFNTMEDIDALISGLELGLKTLAHA